MPDFMERKGVYTRNNITVEIERSLTEVCIVKKMVINGIPIRPYELGHLEDIEPEKAIASGCGNRIFIPNESFYHEKNAERLNISMEDMQDLKELLVELLTIGHCKRCR